MYNPNVPIKITIKKFKKEIPSFYVNIWHFECSLVTRVAKSCDPRVGAEIWSVPSNNSSLVAATAVLTGQVGPRRVTQNLYIPFSICNQHNASLI